MALHHCRVVLVEPLYAGNIGAAARCMRNFGQQDLVLVAPHADHLDRQACQMATHGEEILRSARIVADFGEAVADCRLVVATSAREGGLFRKQNAGPPEEIMPHMVRTLRGDLPAALVFGSEPTGLSNEVISRCNYVVQIPTDASYPALNLAQAVAVCLYALRLEWLRGEVGHRKPDGEDRADFATLERMFAELRTALEEIHFLYGDKADSLMHAVRHLLGKAELSQMEVKLLLGLARQIRWYVQNGEKGRS